MGFSYSVSDPINIMYIDLDIFCFAVLLIMLFVAVFYFATGDGGCG